MSVTGDPPPASSSDPLHQILNQTRERFVASFVAQCDAIHRLVDQIASSDAAGPRAELTHITHRMSGFAGTIGFPTISARASELEQLTDRADGGAFDAVRARALAEAIGAAFTNGLASPPVWTTPAMPIAHGAKILVAEDESDQRAIVMASLEGAGFATIAVVSGDLVVETARAEKPALILLDIAMPRLDGYSVCRLLKADPALAGIPVIFMTAGATVEDRLAGLTMGADEFLDKPVDMRELVLRIQLLLERRGGQPRTSESPAGHVARVPTVIIAEDDPDVTRIVDAQVRASGYTAVIAFDGEEALAAIRAHAADVVLLDLMMPKLNGFDVLTQLRAEPGPRPRVIVLSGRGREQDVMRAFELGADDYMTKPFNPQELMARIARLLE